MHLLGYNWTVFDCLVDESEERHSCPSRLFHAFMHGHCFGWRVTARFTFPNQILFILPSKSKCHLSNAICIFLHLMSSWPLPSPFIVVLCCVFLCQYILYADGYLQVSQPCEWICGMSVYLSFQAICPFPSLLSSFLFFVFPPVHRLYVFVLTTAAAAAKRCDLRAFSFHFLYSLPVAVPFTVLISHIHSSLNRSISTKASGSGQV